MQGRGWRAVSGDQMGMAAILVIMIKPPQQQAPHAQAGPKGALLGLCVCVCVCVCVCGLV